MKDFNLKFNRILSAAIDGLMMFILFAAITVYPTIVLVRDLLNDSFLLKDTLWLGFSIFASFMVWILYLFVSSLIFRNATLGMRINKLVFVKSNGGDMNFRVLLFRETAVVVCYVLSLGFSPIFDAISMFCSKNSKNFYDIFSLTKVVSSDDLL